MATRAELTALRRIYARLRGEKVEPPKKPRPRAWYAPEEGLFKAQLFIKQAGSGYRAYLRAGGIDEVSTAIGNPPKLPYAGSGEPGIYGYQLFEWVFRAPLLEQWMLLRELSYRSFDELPSMRLQLSLDPGSRLSRFCWETMTSSLTDPPLSATVAFSRHVHESRPRRPRGWEPPVQLLLIFSEPDGLQQFDRRACANLKSVNEHFEKHVLHAESPLAVKKLLCPTKGDPGARSMLDGIRSEERHGYHITHLLAHATAHRDTGGVILADQSGRPKRVDLLEIADAIAPPSGARGPQLVFLALPMNGETPGGQDLTNLASQLIKGGVQWVAVVQAPLQPAALSTFVEWFYKTLIETGEVDVSMAEARKQLYRETGTCWDWVWPILFSTGESSIAWGG